MIHHTGSVNRALPVSDDSWTRCQFQWNPEIICGNSPWWDSSVSTVWPIKLVKNPLLAVLTLGPDPICCRWNASSEEKTPKFAVRSLSEYLPPEIWSVGTTIYTMDWFKGKFTGNHRFSHEIWGFPVNFPLIQSIFGHLKHQVFPSEFPPWLRRSGRWQGPGPALPPTWRQSRINQWIPIYESLGILHWESYINKPYIGNLLYDDKPIYYIDY